MHCASTSTVVYICTERNVISDLIENAALVSGYAQIPMVDWPSHAATRTHHDRRIGNGITISFGVLHPRVRCSSVLAEKYSRVHSMRL